MNQTKLLETNPPRLVVLFRRAEDGGEQFQWGVVGAMPIMSVIGGIIHVQSRLVNNVHVPEWESTDQPALVIAWDDTNRTLQYYLHVAIPRVPLAGMLETIKAMLVDSRLAQNAASQSMQSPAPRILGPDGTPAKANTNILRPRGG